MRDPWSPTADELRAWAYAPDATEPLQDWDLIVLQHSGYRPSMLSFVADRRCPNRSYFLAVLYLAAGDLFRSSALPPKERRIELEAFAQQARATGSSWLVTLAERVDALLVGRLPFSYDLWCAGKYAYDQPT